MEKKKKMLEREQREKLMLQEERCKRMDDSQDMFAPLSM
jgi:hypothetical protein